jgi:CTP:molybdopterin cytidylyltransferase MocA
VLRFTGDVGGRELLTQYPEDVLEVKVPDEGLVINVNTPDEYEKHIGSRTRV